MSKIGFKKLSNLLLCEQTIPRKTPSITDRNTDRPINASVCIAGYHIPTIPQNKTPTKTNNPSLRPPAAIDGKSISVKINSQEDSIKKSSNT